MVLGDPGLDIVYSAGDGAWVDPEGRPVARPPDSGPDRTALTRDGVVVAVLHHHPHLLDDARLVAEIQRVARLAIDHERLRADLKAQLRRLRESRTRLVAAGDGERRRLERNLHDGAQQGLVRLALAAGAGGPGLHSVRDELRAALDDLRTLSHGIYSPVLDDAGLGAAIVALAESDPHVRCTALPEGRLPTATEAAAYFCVAAIAEGGGWLDIGGGVQDGSLVLSLRAEALSVATAVEVEDRVGAIDGRAEINRHGDGGAQVRLELPCE
jgi:histidine kinase